MEPTRIDQRVRRIDTGQRRVVDTERVGTTIRVVGMQDPRVFASPKRLLTVLWDDTGTKQDVWSDELEV